MDFAFTHFKNISEVNLEDWGQYASVGNVGILPLSSPETSTSLNLEIVDQLMWCGNKCDCLIVALDPEVYNDDYVKLISHLPYVTFVYKHSDVENLFDNLSITSVFTRKNEEVPLFIKDALSLYSEIEIQVYDNSIKT